MASLRSQGILVTSVKSTRGDVDDLGDTTAAPMLPSRGRAGCLVRVAFGVATLAGAMLLASISHGTVIRCNRVGDNSVTCSVETNIAGYYPLFSEEVAHVEGATAENAKIESRDARTARTSTSTNHQVVVRGAKRTVRSESMSYPLGTSSDAIAAGVNRFLTSSDREYRAWQVEIIPLAMAGALAVVTLLFLVA
ncbi:MAG: hypothetical protein ACXV7D_11035, partial [Thermoanaerobaculia bacterium]